jgi:predicted RNase H-like HicB family nuclease
MPKYSMILQWSEEDGVFVVSLPELPHCKTHGETYAEAAQNGQDMIESLLEFYEQEQKPLPTPQFFTDAALEIV